jgi:hypothetical protein
MSLPGGSFWAGWFFKRMRQLLAKTASLVTGAEPYNAQRKPLSVIQSVPKLFFKAPLTRPSKVGYIYGE